MKYDAKIHHRRSIRLHHYDYALPGAYFVTLCSFNRRCIFGWVVEDRMDENDCGKIAREQWLESAQIRQEFELDTFVVMPNHLHGILWIVGPSGARPYNRSEHHSALPPVTDLITG
jgi:REP element-mobilizing transposase RayT